MFTGGDMTRLPPLHYPHLTQHHYLNVTLSQPSCFVLMIDDVQFISDKGATQEEFFHTFNALVDQGKQIILSADKSPTDLAGVGARLTSRMCMGLVAAALLEAPSLPVLRL